MTTYQNSEVCQKCAKCCKCWWIYTDLKDDAMRVAFLNTKLISQIKVKDNLWKIIFNIPCKKLIEKNGKYYCENYDGIRPDYCIEYPMNFKGEPKEVIEVESRICPIIKEVLK